MKEVKPYLRGVVSGIEAIASYRPGNEADFMSDPKTQDAVLMRLQDIGENLCKVRDNFPDFWEKHAADTWIKAIGLRNIISHGYAQVDLAVIWTLIAEDLESFKSSIETLL